MLCKTVKPKTKAELIRALQAASFRSFEIYEGEQPVAGRPARLAKLGDTVIVLQS